MFLAGEPPSKDAEVKEDASTLSTGTGGMGAGSREKGREMSCRTKDPMPLGTLAGPATQARQGQTSLHGVT